MSTGRLRRILAGGLLIGTMMASVAPAHSAETVAVGTVGSASANLWPVFIGINKGLFAANDIKLDLVYVQSSAAMIQQLTAGSLDITLSTGLVDPIRAIDKGAPLAIVGFEAQSAPYALVARPEIKSPAGLRGKTISVGGVKDITRIFLERMLAPSGIRPGEFDMVYAGATAARAAALLSGAVDAAIVLPPYNFRAMDRGFNQLGLAADFVPELPFSGTIANIAWAKGHAALLRRLLEAHAKSLAWFADEHNRAEAVAMMVKASGVNADEVEKAYDFYRGGNYFEPTGKVSQRRLRALLEVLQGLGDVSRRTAIDRLLLPGVTQMTD